MPSINAIDVPDTTTAYDKLKLLILDGQIALGQPLVERAIATRLGVSRTPVREAIARLERDGLVRMVEGRGAFVASYSVEDVIEIYHVRLGLEPLAARLSCANIAVSPLDEFERLLIGFRNDSESRNLDPDGWRKVGRNFHELFIRASGSNRIIQILEGMRYQIELVRGIGRAVEPDSSHRSTIDEHLEILNALRERNADRAEKAVQNHLQNGLRYRLSGLQHR